MRGNFDLGEEEKNDVREYWIASKKRDDTANCKWSTVLLFVEYCFEKSYGLVVRVAMEWMNE